jgi:hypothetical protein
MSLIGDAARPTSMSRLGADMEALEEDLHAVCLGFVMQPCTHLRMKSKVSSEPELTGIWWAAPSVGQGAREAGTCQQQLKAISVDSVFWTSMFSVVLIHFSTEIVTYQNQHISRLLLHSTFRHQCLP